MLGETHASPSHCYDTKGEEGQGEQGERRTFPSLLNKHENQQETEREGKGRGDKRERTGKRRATRRGDRKRRETGVKIEEEGMER